MTEPAEQAILSELRRLNREIGVLAQRDRAPMTQTAVARAFGVTRMQVWRWIRDGKIKSDSQSRISQAEFERFQRARSLQNHRKHRNKSKSTNKKTAPNRMRPGSTQNKQ